MITAFTTLHAADAQQLATTTTATTAAITAAATTTDKTTDKTPAKATATTKGKDKGKNKSDDAVDLPLLVVTAKTRGIIPLGAWVRSTLIGNHATTPATIFTSDHPAHLATLAKYGLSSGERIISIDGEKVQGMTASRLNEIWCEGDPGRQVTFVVQGSGENESVFRKVVVTTISVARLRKIEDEWRQQHPDKVEDAEKEASIDSEWKWRKW